MAVMLRSIGVPARVAVGFTEGEEDPERPDSYTISTDNLHSWVEVPFGTYGWLSFEPTPIRENPVAVSYQQPEAEDTCRGAECPRRGPGQQDGIDGPTPAIDEVPRQALPVPAAGGDGGGAGGDGDLRRVLIWLTAGLVLLAAAAVPLARWLLRRRRLRRARGEPRRSVLATYDVLSERAADLGAGRGPGETPLEYLRRLDASDRLADGHLARLTAVTTRAAYAAEPPTHEDALDAEADAREILRALRRTTPPLRRLTGAYRPGATPRNAVTSPSRSAPPRA